MISRLHICFSRMLAVVSLLPGMALAGTVNGKVTPASVIWLSPLDRAPGELTPAAHARMIQKSKRFDPHLLAVEVGTSVDFPNLDPIFHNAFSNFDGQLFDIGLYPPGSSRSIRFHREGLVRVFCNIHPSMSAVIVVLATPYFAVTDEKGDFSIPNVPPGQYKLHFFHERATPETLDTLTREVTVARATNDLGEVQISEAGYIPTPHKNKYGRDYPVENPGLYH
jgi:plastocyanin